MRSSRKALFLTLILLATLLPFSLAIGDPGWLMGWDYRVKITIDSGDIDTALTDFPILVYLSDSSGIDSDNLTFIFDEIGANYLKIAITEDDGITECYVEVEGWDSVNDKGWLWTKIASINNVSDTEIYLYYDNEHADNTAYVGVTTTAPAEKVWDSNFKLVYHMRDKGVNEEMWDSTDNDMDGNKTAINNPNMVSGKIDKAQDFDDTAPYDYITHANIDISSSGFVEAWMKFDDLATDHTLVSLTEFTTGGPEFQIWMDNFSPDRMGIAISDGGWNVVYGTSNPGTVYFHYIGFWYNGSMGRLYFDGIQEGADLLNTITDFSNTWRVGMSNRVDIPEKPMDGIIDEYRVSTYARSESWIKATYETGRDHMLDFGSEEEFIPLETPAYLFGAGFNASSPYVSIYWKSNLTGITLFEVQNSTDKISWDYLGSNTTREYHDFQVVNGTERYYRVRACNFTGAGWDNSTWTDINFETVYFVMPIGDGVCQGYEFNASSIAVIAGTLNDGNLASTYSIDGDWYNVSETNTPPGLDIRVNFTYVGENVTCGCIEIYQTYTGHSHHEIQVQAWNFTSSSWRKIGKMLFNETVDWVCVGLGHEPGHYLSDGEMWFRFYHPLSGHLAHELHIDRIDLRVVYAGECPECPPCEEAPALVAMGKYYALAIILLILGLLLGLGMRKR